MDFNATGIFESFDRHRWIEVSNDDPVVVQLPAAVYGNPILDFSIHDLGSTQLSPCHFGGFRIFELNHCDLLRLDPTTNNMMELQAWLLRFARFNTVNAGAFAECDQSTSEMSGLRLLDAFW